METLTNEGLMGSILNRLLISLLLTGCATGTYSPPSATTDPPLHERVINKSFDETWSSLVDYTSGAFFGIDRFEKASGLMTLNFGAAEPHRFIECGHMKAQLGPQAIDMPYAQFMHERYAAKLDGKMNLLVKAIEPTKTLVRVNARYIFTAPAAVNFPAATWVFDSGGQSTITVSGGVAGSIPTRTCRPTYEAERAALEAVSK